MTGKLTFLAGMGVGYVLGARAGRERYEQIVTKANELMRDPRVQQTAGQATHLAKEKADQAQHKVRDMASSHSGSPNGTSTGQSASTGWSPS